MKIAPIPKRKHSRSMVLYTAMENLHGSATRLELYKESRMIWSEIAQEKPPSTMDDFQKILSSSAVTQGYLIRTSSRKVKNPTYTFAAYEVFRSKAEPALLSRTMYSLSQIENGQQTATKKRIEKLERILEDPTTGLPEPREWELPRGIASPESVPNKAEPDSKQIEKEKPANIDDVLERIETILERQKPAQTTITPSKLEVPIWPAVIGVSIAGIAIIVAVCLSILALSS
jgi:hypothetical protein